MNKDEILEMICKHTVSSRVEQGTDLIHEVYVNDFVDELLKAINFTHSSLQLKKEYVINFEEWKNRFVKETETNNVYELKGDYVIGEDLITEYEQDMLLYESLIV